MRAGSRLPGSTPNNLYPTGDAQYIHITAASDAVFRRVTQAIGEPALATDARFATALARVEHEDAIDDIITRWTRAHTCAEAERKMHAAEVPAARIYTVADIFADPHYAARGMLAKVADEELGTVTMPDVVPRLSMTPGAIRHSGHRVGQDTRRVLSELAGLSAAEIDELEAERIITCDSTADIASGVEASEAS
jgi:crotonobetainyl-CoA:carnitine CoA-transferase CaiB-like acyl-CoA transferase